MPDPIAFRSFSYTGWDDLPPLSESQVRNPVLAGFYPDPSCCRVGDDYYLVNSTFAYFPGIPIFHSRDLVHWRQIGNVIHRPEQLDYRNLGVSEAIFAPAITHHAGTFYVICTQIGAGGNFVVTASDPAGPWSDPVYLGFEGIDPSLFIDPVTGSAYIVNNGAPAVPVRYEGHRSIWIQEFDPTAMRMVGERQVLVDGGVDPGAKPIWIEGPHLYHREGWYYLCAAEGGTGDQHSQTIFRSASPRGPFVPWSGNPILTQRDLDGTVPHAVTSTGHADLVIGPDGEWWAMFLGCRPYGGRWYATGRETFLLPVTWTEDGWPVILPPGQRVPLSIEPPRMPASFAIPEAPPLTGNFAWSDGFDQAELSPAYVMLRTPLEQWWSVGGGRLALIPRSDRLDSRGNPSYLARRVQHARFAVSTTLDLPATPGVSAGLVVFQSDTHHYYLGVRRTADRVEVFLERHAGKDDGGWIARAVFAADTGRLELELTCHDALATARFRPIGGAWTTLLGNLDATILTTQACFGFVGTTVGMHARVEPG